MLGIALGAFTTGFSQGVQLGAGLREMRKQRKLEAGLASATEAGSAEFDKQVAGGQETSGDWETAYANYIVPRYAKELAMAGEPDKALAWTDWASQAKVKHGAKLFGEGLQAFHLGDTKGAIDKMIRAANTSGYGPDGKMSVAEYYDEQAGAVTGYRLTFKMPDGQEHTKNVATEDLPTFFANIANPQAAFELDQATKAAKSKADLEVETYGRKKQVEKDLGVGTGALTPAQYQNAIQEERKRIDSDALISGEDLTDAQKEQRAKQIVDARFGRAPAAAQGEQVTVDPDTGEQVQTPATDATAQAAVPTDEALGAADQPVSADQTQVDPNAQMGSDQPTGDTAPGIVAQTPAAATTQVDPTQRQAYIDQATQLMKQGGNAQKIAEQLTMAGVPPDQWPQAVQLAARSAQLGVSQ